MVLLGSAPLLVEQGLSESLAGRFEVIRVPHWSLAEMRAAFGITLDEYIYFGGYPGAAPLIGDEARWRRYVLDALIETTISRDVLLLTRVDKPALLRRLFELGCRYSGQELSYTKMLGQLHDAGNTTTLAHYLELLAGAGLLTGLPKFSGNVVRRRGSSPKLQVLNTALATAQSGRSFADARADGEAWGRLVESAVGAHLANAAATGECRAVVVARGGPRGRLRLVGRRRPRGDRGQERAGRRRRSRGSPRSPPRSPGSARSGRSSLAATGSPLERFLLEPARALGGAVGETGGSAFAVIGGTHTGPRDSSISSSLLLSPRPIDLFVLSPARHSRFRRAVRLSARRIHGCSPLTAAP